MTYPSNLKAEEIKAQYPAKQVDRWIEVGYRNWAKRQNRTPKPHKELDQKLKQLSSDQLKQLISKL